MDIKDLDEIVSVDDGDAILMAQKLANEVGMGVGISSGANFLGALMVQEEIGRNEVVVTVFADDNKKYLSTDLLRKETIKDNHLAPHIKLTGIRAIKQACHTCCDPQECREAVFREVCKDGSVPPCPIKI